MRDRRTAQSQGWATGFSADGLTKEQLGSIAMAATRRGVVSGMVIGAAACTASAAQPAPGASGRARVFGHGVASGDPLANRVIIWTRAKPTNADGAIQVTWEMAEDAGFETVLRAGLTTAMPEKDWCVKVDVDRLPAGGRFFYRFRAGSEYSPVGQTRTAPSKDADVGSLKFAVVSCSNYPAGYFNVYDAIASRGDVDLVLHLGDYIYEYGAGGYATQWGQTVGRVPDPPHEIVSLQDYRTRIAQYRTDPDLQAAHAACPWLVTWDDHETTNDSWTAGAQYHDDSEGSWTDRKAAALQAYYEWMPIRDPEPGKAFEAINRSFDWGRLATIAMLETRLLARSQQLEYERDLDVVEGPDGKPMPDLPGFYANKLNDPARQLLGTGQENWLKGVLTASTARGVPWQVLGNQVIMAEVRSPDFNAALPNEAIAGIVAAVPQAKAFFELSSANIPLNLDAWDGYPAARERLYGIAREARANLVVCTGDTHAAWANTLADADGQVRGVEFGCSSVSSPSIADLLSLAGVEGNTFGALITAANDSVAWNDQTKRGYVLVTLTPDKAEGRFISVDTIFSKTFLASTQAVFATEASGGPKGLVQIGG